MEVITRFGGREVLPLGILVTVILLLFMRRYIQAAGFLIANAGGYLLVIILKMAIQRERPLTEYTSVEVAGYSYPSGHAMMASIFYGMLAYFLIRAVDLEAGFSLSVSPCCHHDNRIQPYLWAFTTSAMCQICRRPVLAEVCITGLRFMYKDSSRCRILKKQTHHHNNSLSSVDHGK